MSSVTGGSRRGEHAVYPGTFDPVTPGHLDVIERARHLFARVTVVVAVNSNKQPASNLSERATQLRRRLPVDWANVSVAAWSGLTVAFCRQHGADVIIRGVRDPSDLLYESRLAAMNQHLGITTLFLPARPGLTAMSSTVLRDLGNCRAGLPLVTSLAWRTLRTLLKTRTPLCGRPTWASSSGSPPLLTASGDVPDTGF